MFAKSVSLIFQLQNQSRGFRNWKILAKLHQKGATESISRHPTKNKKVNKISYSSKKIVIMLELRLEIRCQDYTHNRGEVILVPMHFLTTVYTLVEFSKCHGQKLIFVNSPEDKWISDCDWGIFMLYVIPFKNKARISQTLGN